MLIKPEVKEIKCPFDEGFWELQLRESVDQLEFVFKCTECKRKFTVLTQ